MNFRFALVAIASLAVGACSNTTSRLSQAQERQFASEGIVHRADDVQFRYTLDPGGRRERWENRKASIIVTKFSLLIHKNEKVGLSVTARTQRDVGVQRSGARVRIRSGRGAAEEVWSFEPPGDAAGWTTDIRAVMKSAKVDPAR